MTPAALLVAAALRLAPCQLPGVPEPLRCGTLDVAENRAAPAGRRIGLRVVVVPAMEATPGAAPLFHLEGGPGVAATGVAALYAVELPEYRRRPATYHLTRGAFAEQVRTRLYAPASRRALPLAIHAASQGDCGPFLKPLTSGGGGPEIAEGLYLSVTCAEDVPFVDPAEAERLAAGTALGTYRVREQRAACAQWPRGAVSGEFRRPVESKAPTLVVSGERDPVTPPRLGEQVVRHLANGRHVVIPQGAHVPVGIEPVACLDHVMLRFFADPFGKDLDAGCLKDMRAPPFVLPSP